MNAPEPYRQFLEAKVKLASQDGFHVDMADINPQLKPHVRVAVQWALAGGRRAFFARFGMQKTTWHLEIMRLVMKHTGRPVLIVVPLGARLSFFNDARDYFAGDFAIRLKFIQSSEEIDAGAINLTNTESVREGKIDPSLFGGTTFDEGDILRNQSTKTFWEFVRNWTDIALRFVATATPDPQDYTELLAYASYLGIMDIGQARTRFFKRNSEKADELTLHPHKEKEFWLWVASWALFLYRPSDLGEEFSDEGYDLPELDVRWQEVPSDHSKAKPEASGQGVLLKDASLGIKEAAAEKRDSIGARLAKLQNIRRELPDAHRLIWHDLNDERDAIKKTIPEIAIVTGSMDLEKREVTLMDFAAGRIAEMAGKPSMIGSGGNYQAHCWHAVFLGVGYKFKDFIQAIHRIQRYGQLFKGLDGIYRRVRVDIIFTEAEREIVAKLKERWQRYDEQAARMSALMREYGLAKTSLGLALTRSMGTTREEVKGERFTLVRNDCVEETRNMPENSVDLIVTSIPFSGQYEYTPSYNDFGHSDNDDHFFEQMDFLTPELLRVLKPGRNCAIHCKDRIIEGSRSGLGFQTVGPFGARTMFHFMEHGFAYLGTAYLAGDVVRENYGSNRLGFTEQCKDGSRMGFGLGEYVHLFRKPQTDRSRGYADDPVIKLKRDYDPKTRQWSVTAPRAGVDESRCDPEGYSRARWQLDANGFWRSDGNRFLTPSELASLSVKGIWRRWKKHSLEFGYDYQHHVDCGEALMVAGKLKPDWAVIPVHSVDAAIQTDIVRMRTLNTLQAAKGKEKHICPLPFDIVERIILERSMPNELVYDPFAGLGTVPYVAVKYGRRGYGCELSPEYFPDSVSHCRSIELKVAAPTLFDALEAEENSPSPEPAESDDRVQNVAGGPERPSMVAEQAGELEAGETAAVSASSARSPVLDAPGDPASVKGASAEARGHAPPAINSVSDGVSMPSLPSGESEPSVMPACAPSDDAGPEKAPLGLDAGAAAPGREPTAIELPAFLGMPNPFTAMDRSNPNTVVRQHGGTSAVEHDAPSTAGQAGGASTSFDDYPEIPEKLRRRRGAA
jgi:DNA modification methylase